MKAQTILITLFAAVALAAPADEPTRVVRNPTKVQHKRYYGEQFCDCVDDCTNANAGSGGEGGVGLGACMDGCYDFPTPTAGTCSELGG
ncbi:hypothetical protein VFPPC_16212 [Pochonia chlamydosporia 170]|uniref:Uncharacterized protein n=1 Tax=Pochonia chlamydosporia 170 TaxID=1380566 RepID=A0A179FHA3_METCM|nr:hypothetical protein VFPPC_16212 [Pochonia chlamydosporia 170]OAQ64429.1 hypothetical protein VFPPC_16212 [Pochonia chlamydosporia 170]